MQEHLESAILRAEVVELTKAIKELTATLQGGAITAEEEAEEAPKQRKKTRRGLLEQEIRNLMADGAIRHTSEIFRMIAEPVEAQCDKAPCENSIPQVCIKLVEEGHLERVRKGIYQRRAA